MRFRPEFREFQNIGVFHRLVHVITREVLNELADKYKTDKYRRKFFTIQHFYSLILFFMTDKESLRDLWGALNKSFYFKMICQINGISLSQLSRSNNERDYRFFEEVLMKLLSIMGRVLQKEARIKELKEFRIIDSTFLKLCLSIFPWAEYKKENGGIKLHMRFDSELKCPDSIVISEGKMNDHEAIEDLIDFSSCGVTYVFDRGYNDYTIYDKICSSENHFVTRMKSNASYQIIKNNDIPQEEVNGVKILSDQIIRLGQEKSKTLMKNNLRLVHALVKMENDEEEEFFFLTSRFDLEAEVVARIYKERWQIELFFKWIKQHMRIKSFISRTPNGVAIQIYTAIILYVLVLIYRRNHHPSWSVLDVYRKLKYTLVETEIANYFFQMGFLIAYTLSLSSLLLAVSWMEKLAWFFMQQ